MEWISTKDRLPDNKTMCIGYFKTPYRGEFMVGEIWHNQNKWYWDLDLVSVVTHWMPLPESPK